MANTVMTIKYPTTLDVDGQTINVRQTILDSFAEAYKWPAQVEDTDPESPTFGETIDNPETKDAHVHRKIVEYVAGITNAHAPDIKTAQAVVTTAKAGTNAVVNAVSGLTEVTVTEET